MKVQSYAVRLYEAADGSEPFSRWMYSLRNDVDRARIDQRLSRLANGNFGDCKMLKAADGVQELRLHFGSGYGVYFGITDETIVLLLCGGDKSSQNKDIRRAIGYWSEYRLKRIQ